MKTRLQQLQKGESLLEVLIALAIISIVVTSVATIITTTLNNATFNENQTLATKYAQEADEYVRQIRNQSYSTFKLYNGLYCFGKGQTSLGVARGACSAPNVGTFIRSVQIEQSPGCGANVAKVTVSVSFIDGKCPTGTYCHVQTHTSCLSTVNPNASL